MQSLSTLDLNKGDLLAKADHEFELFNNAFKKSKFEIARKHITNAFKLKTICAYNTNISDAREKTILYLEASRLAAIAGDTTRCKFLLSSSKDFGLTFKTHDKLRCLTIDRYPYQHNIKLANTLPSNNLNAPINIGDVFLLDAIKLQVAFGDTSYIAVSSDYAICISDTFYDRNIFYLVSARKFVCEAHTYISFCGVNVSADFNFMPSEITGRVNGVKQ